MKTPNIVHLSHLALKWLRRVDLVPHPQLPDLWWTGPSDFLFTTWVCGVDRTPFTTGLLTGDVIEMLSSGVRPSCRECGVEFDAALDARKERTIL